MSFAPSCLVFGSIQSHVMDDVAVTVALRALFLELLLALLVGLLQSTSTVVTDYYSARRRLE